MTAKDLSAYYGLPIQVIQPYEKEFIANTPGTAEYIAASDSWYALNRTEWQWFAGNKDEPVTVGVTAFSPPSAYAINVQGRGAWMLEHVGSSLGYHEINFSGWIDSRLGNFYLAFYPVYRGEVAIMPGVDLIFWTGRCDAAVRVNNFTGIESIIVMLENGLAAPYDLQRLKAARAYLNAQQRYGTELSVTRQLMQQNADREVLAIKSDMAARLQEEKNQLAREKTAIILALQNETRSAMRDMQQLVLTVQQLKITG